jgi:hypothetical protein
MCKKRMLLETLMMNSVIFLIGTSQMTTIEENITQVLKCHYYDSANLVRYRHFVPDKFYFIIGTIKIF